ncbi:unnamed protein product [Sphagnum jensenii]|uniref:Uncharacterized protein n=1 Tax=Sphagnum jensenii TaxID=128206 RepID=A0ABP0XH31_9BRYO
MRDERRLVREYMRPQPRRESREGSAANGRDYSSQQDRKSRARRRGIGNVRLGLLVRNILATENCSKQSTLH